LQGWSRQGVLLLNATLTVKAADPNSHSSFGWDKFTDRVIELLNQKHAHLVFILWGNFAQKKAKSLNLGKHLVLKGPHPSPFSADSGFFGCKHFSKANTFLKSHSLTPIDWSALDL